MVASPKMIRFWLQLEFRHGQATSNAVLFTVFYTRDNQDSGERSVLCEVVLVDALCTALVHNGVMTAKEKTVRQSVTLPAKVATQVRSMAKRRRLSANRMLIELVEEGLEAKQQKEKAFFELAERFRAAADPKEVERLGEELGHMVFGK
jgi:hypothetical protein